MEEGGRRGGRKPHSGPEGPGNVRRSPAEDGDRYRHLLDILPDSLFSVDLSSGSPRIDLVSPGIAKITGCGPADLAPDPEICFSLVHPDDRAEVKKSIEGVMAGTAVWPEVRIVRNDGSVRWVRVTCIPAAGPDGRVVRVAGIVTDVTGRREAEEAGRRLREQLYYVSKMEAIGTLAGGIAHDFNNMLGVIIGYASLLKSQMTETHPFYVPVDTIVRSAERAADLTRQLLGFARGGKYKAEPLSLSDVAQRVIALIGRSLDPSVAVESSLAKDLPPTEGDIGQLEHLLMNLCINARDAMPRGGVLRLETAAEALGEEFVANRPWARKGSFVRLSVIDTGVGMPPETMRRMFEPFFTTKEPGKGTGMGLAMVYGAVKNHGGFIDVRSEPGRGSAFHLYFPVSWRTRQSSPPDPEGEVRGGTELLLLAEGDPTQNGIASMILTHAGYRVLRAGTGEEACALLAGDGADAALAIVAAEIPGMGGKQTFLTLRGTRPGIPVVVTSAHGVEGVASEILQMGGAAYIDKPYRPEAVLRAVRRALDSK